MLKLTLSARQVKKLIKENHMWGGGQGIEGRKMGSFIMMNHEGYMAVYEQRKILRTVYCIEYEDETAPNVWKNWFKFAHEMPGDDII